MTQPSTEINGAVVYERTLFQERLAEFKQALLNDPQTPDQLQTILNYQPSTSTFSSGDFFEDVIKALINKDRDGSGFPAATNMLRNEAQTAGLELTKDAASEYTTFLADALHSHWGDILKTAQEKSAACTL